LGVARAIDIGCGNAALALVGVALQQVLKSLLPVFVCVLSALVLRRRVSTRTWLALLPIVVGSFMAARGATSATAAHSSSTPAAHAEGVPLAFANFGAFLAVVSTIGRAVKAVLNARLLAGGSSNSGGAATTDGSGGGPVGAQGKSVVVSGVAANVSAGVAPPLGRLTPLDILTLEAPTSGVILLSLACLLLERGRIFDGTCVTSGDAGAALATNLVGGALMFLNQLSYVAVIDRSDALTCQVVMNVKMMLLIVVSLALTPVAGAACATAMCRVTSALWGSFGLGVLVAFAGVMAYAAAERRNAREAQARSKWV
jgi:hypothetical protein